VYFGFASARDCEMPKKGGLRDEVEDVDFGKGIGLQQDEGG
jgi:hypothetical protein